MDSAHADLAPLSPTDRQLVESWLREFLRAWDENRLAAFVRKLPAAGHPLRLPALVEMVKLDLREQWRRGRRAIVEAYLKTYPELGGQDTAPVGLILAEYEMRVQA